MTTRIFNREARESAVLCKLPGIDEAARLALFRAFSRSYPPSAEAMSAAEATVMRCRIDAMKDEPRPSLWFRIRRLFGKAVKQQDAIGGGMR